MPDPIVDRLGKKKAYELHLSGARSHVADVREQFGVLVDVVSQCETAEAMISNPEMLLQQRPVVLCSGSFLDGRGDSRLLVSGLNPNRETKGIAFHFALNGAPRTIRYELPVTEKEEEITLAMPLVHLDFVPAEEIELLMNEMAVWGKGLVIKGKADANDRAMIPLPIDIPLYVSVWDRGGLKSDTVPFHQNLRVGMSEVTREIH